MKDLKASTLLMLLINTVLLGGAPLAAEDLTSRVPADKIAAAKELRNPIAAGDSIPEAKKIFTGKGRCYTCHGLSGRGDGPAGSSFNPRPRDFTDAQWQRMRTDGEIFWAISEGTEYGMIPFGGILSEKERWLAVNYIRELGKNRDISHETAASGELSVTK